MLETKETARVLEPLPAKMQDLLIDEKHGPIPWFVGYVDGKPEFRAMDYRKFVLALNEKLCWVCGSKLGVYKAFVAGPMCGVNRTSAEPPSHLECARWSARNCPFLSNPRMVRREDNMPEGVGEMAGEGLRRNPGVAMLWITRQYEIFNDGRGGKLIQMGEPESVEWWCRARPATRAEVQASIDSGLPNLEALARQEKGGLAFLQKSIERFGKWLPPWPQREPDAILETPEDVQPHPPVSPSA